MSTDNTADRWGAVAKTFHWGVAALVLLQLAYGLRNATLDMYDPVDAGWYVRTIAGHKSMGLVVLALVVLRLAWRGMHGRPVLPPQLPAWQRKAAQVSHGFLYAALILQPVLGYLQSAAFGTKTTLFNLFVVPNIVPLMWQRPYSRALWRVTQDGHSLLGLLLAIAITVHMAAALKHHFILRDNVLRRMLPFGMAALLLCGLRPAHAAPDDVATMMRLLPQWLGGHYSTQAQYDADQASNKPESEKHRRMFQLLQRVDLPGFEGLVVFEQGSTEGTTDPEQIWRAGFLQFIPDPGHGVVRQRELHFKDDKPFRNAHLTPSKFKAVTADLLTWDEACDFLLTLSANKREISGPIPAKSCKVVNPGTGKTMYADDRIVVKSGEFHFLGRYRDEDGRVVWGNESGELNRLVRFKAKP